MTSLGMTDDEIKEFADPMHWFTYFPRHCIDDLKRMGLKVRDKQDMPPGRCVHFVISQPKHMLWVLKRTVSLRWLFRAHKTLVLNCWIFKIIYSEKQLKDI